MDVHRWKDLQHKMGTARRQQLRQQVEQAVLRMDLRGLRGPSGKTREDER